MQAVLFAFLFGIGVLLLSTRVFISFVERLTYTIGISPIVIAATIVAIGTSLPELVVSVIAILRGDVGLAIGNIVGSNIVNILLVVPCGILLGKFKIHTRYLHTNMVFLVGSAILFSVISFTKPSSYISGGLLLVAAIAITIVEFVRAQNSGKKISMSRFSSLKKIGAQDALFFIASLIGIVIGGIATVASVEEIARMSGISTTILGLSMTAIATSLPELFATIISHNDKEPDIAIGNIIGSNIYNLVLIGGIIALFSQNLTIPFFDLGWLLGVTVVLVGILERYHGKVVPRWVGYVLLLLCVIFLKTLRS